MQLPASYPNKLKSAFFKDKNTGLTPRPFWHKKNFPVTIVYPVRTAASQAAKTGSNPVGDAKFGYKEECQGVKSLGISCFKLPVRFPQVYSSPVASTIFVGIFVGINVLCSFPIPTQATAWNVSKFVHVGIRLSNKVEVAKMPLTDTHIRSLKPEARPRKYFDGGGLFLYVPTTGSKLWRMAYRFEGKSKLLSFGDYPTISLKDARAKREEAKGLLARGIDPSEQKKSAKEAQLTAERDSFENIALDWHRTRLAEFSAKHRGTVLYRLNTYIFPEIGKRHIARLEAKDILAIVKPIEEKGNSETSRRVLQIIS